MPVLPLWAFRACSRANFTFTFLPVNICTGVRYFSNLPDTTKCTPLSWRNPRAVCLCLKPALNCVFLWHKYHSPILVFAPNSWDLQQSGVTKAWSLSGYSSRLGDRGFVLGILEKADFSLLPIVEIGSGAHPSTRSMSTGDQSGQGVQLTPHVGSI